MEAKKIGIPMEGLAELSRVASAQGAVLLKNEEQVLPFKKEDKISIFGRCQINYYRSGTGSGGAVNVEYTTNILDGFKEVPEFAINEELVAMYKEFVKEHPFDNGGGGWAAEPWHQAEMPLTKELVSRAAGKTNKALIVIGRTAGEDQDNADKPGSYQLTEIEEDMLKKVCAGFDQVIVALNVSNIVDMSFMQKEYAEKIKAVIYLWHGGIEGGRAAVDVLTGKVTPSGKLTDTIAYSINDYPSTKGYGNKEKVYYTEDVYVGYRYFETFCPEKVQFPFGYGLSYTEFAITNREGVVSKDSVHVKATVENTGSHYAGKEVVQVYVEAPQGKLGRAKRELVGFAKTGLLNCKEKESLEILIPLYCLAAYDDSGITGNKACYVLEEGEYVFYVGNSVRDAQEVFTMKINELQIIERLQEAGAPRQAFERIKPGRKKEDGTYEVAYEKVPLSTVDLEKCIQENLPKELEVTGNRGYSFRDVQSGKVSLDSFVAQFSVEDLATIVRGEGMCSPKVTPGTAAAFGGVSDSLLEYGIPIGCAADGPSGIRMDTGAKATQLAIGTLLACTWDTKLVEELFTLQGKELVRNEIDTLLGPGINIHRNPLNGRNFEYFSEDPMITGSFAAATVRGISRYGAEGTVKHFACNSQETGRQQVDAIVSERALREIYLKGFEMAVKVGGAKSIMTAYNPVNGHWTASNYELNTTILRKEWGYTGIVMTDWWANMNDVAEGGSSTIKDTRSMVRSQNDLFMVVNNNGAEINAHEDNTLESLENGKLTIGELQRCAKNIINFLLEAPAAGREVKAPVVLKIEPTKTKGTVVYEQKENTITVPVAKICGEHLEGIKEFTMKVDKAGIYNVTVKITSTESERAQMICKASLNEVEFTTFQINGVWGKWMSQKLARVELLEGSYTLKLNFISPGIQIDNMEFELWDK